LHALVKLYRAPFSTNSERVALALAHKGLEVESVWIEYGDRSPVEEVSGQGLVPVLFDVDDDLVVRDSTAIIEYLEAVHPEPPLYPTDPARATEMEVFIDWFNLVWKTWPNGIETELGKSDPDDVTIGAYSHEMEVALHRFEAMLSARDHLMSDELAAADCIVYPFVKFALHRDPEDDELFHRILEDHQSVEGRPRVRAWIERMDACPRA
jgi:glutathione S-transferase